MGPENNNVKNPGSEHTVSGHKATLFKIAAILFPFILLLLLEAGLRVSGYGSDFPLFVEAKDRPGYLVMNQDVSQKYFFSKQNATSGYREYFKKEKDPGVYRIFVLGASTGVGYPYFTNGSFHRWLQYALNETFPKQRIEVINLSLTAVNSYTLLDFTPALIEQQPDAVLIYAGHNEYYGAMGVGSVNSLGQYPGLVNSVLKLRNLRTIQLATDAYLSMRAAFSSNPEEQETLMRRMAANQAIRFGSDTYEAGIDQFRHNMDALLAQLNEHQIPSFISTVASNEKDIAPFISDSSSTGATASAHYQKGRQAYQNEQYKTAKSEFLQAKELDMLRFRAPEEINEAIRLLSDAFPAVHLVDNKKRFDEASPHGIPGNELLAEHVHPNLQGYSLIAYGFYQSLKGENPFGLQWPDSLSLDDLRRQMPITEADSLQGLLEVSMLKSGWPYYEKTELPEPKSVPENIAGQLVLKNISWEEAMQQQYRFYEQNGEQRKALKVMEAFLLEHPENNKANFDAAKLAVQLGDSSRATRYFAKAFESQRTTIQARKIAARLIRNGYFGAAIRYLNYITETEPEDYVSRRLQDAINAVLEIPEPPASISQKVEKALHQAQIYQMVGEDGRAMEYVNTVLQLDPGNKEAQSLSQKIYPS